MYNLIFKKICILFLFLFVALISWGQEQKRFEFLIPSDTLNKKRLWAISTTGAISYTGAVIGLNEIWYAQFERSKFHFFDDVGEWQDMDKIGHLYTAFIQSNWSFQGLRWAGVKRRNAMWVSVGIGTLLQGTIEVLDGYSENWGFSVADIGFNAAGCVLFLGQELLWQEQRILMKVSAHKKSYSDFLVSSTDGSLDVTVANRAAELYGSSYLETFFKDYNAQTLWASINVKSFLNNKDSKFPNWLNVAVGYGAENMFGGFENEWPDTGPTYFLDHDLFPRHRQFYLSLDIDLTRIKTKSPFLKTLFSLVNVIKIPAPALEINTLGNIKFHPIYF